MDGVGTPIIGRPRPLPGHDTPNPAYHPHTLNYEEPENWQFALIMDSQRWANLSTVTDRELTPLFLEQKLGWIQTIRVYTPLLTKGIEQYADALTSHLEKKLKGECLWD